MCNFANLKLVMSRHRKELPEAPEARGLRSWSTWPMRKSATVSCSKRNSTKNVYCADENHL